MNKNFYYIPIFMILLMVYANMSYKAEILTCDRSQNACSVTKINWLNNKKTIYLTSFDNIKNVETGHYVKNGSSRSSSGRRYTTKYDRYSVRFVGVDGKNSLIFSGYRNRGEAEQDANAIGQLFKNNSNIIEYQRQ